MVKLKERVSIGQPSFCKVFFCAFSFLLLVFSFVGELLMFRKTVQEELFLVVDVVATWFFTYFSFSLECYYVIHPPRPFFFFGSSCQPHELLDYYFKVTVSTNVTSQIILLVFTLMLKAAKKSTGCADKSAMFIPRYVVLPVTLPEYIVV